jgi:hypothetical protein
MNNTTWVSLGENCVSQWIINDLGLKTIISPYSWGFSTIDHIINLQEEDFTIENYAQENHPFLHEKYTIHKTSKNSNDSFFVSSSKTFAFRHHDFFSNYDNYKKIKRRMNRYKSLNSDEIVFLYHHRIGQTPSSEYVRSRLEYFLLEYYPKAKALMFYEVESKQKGIRLVEDKNNVFEIEVKTIVTHESQKRGWKLENSDLHKKMLDYVLEHLL